MSSTHHDLPTHERSASTQSASESEVLNEATEVSSPAPSSETGLCSTCSTSPAVQAYIQEEALQAADQVVAEEQDRYQEMVDTYQRVLISETAQSERLRDEAEQLRDGSEQLRDSTLR